MVATTERTKRRRGSASNGHAQPSPTGTLPTALLLHALRAYRGGDFSVRLPLDLTGVGGEVAQAFNEIVEQNARLTAEIARLNTVVGKHGRLGQRATLGDASGDWRSCIESLNELIDDLIHPTTDVGRVIRAVASGDLGQTMSLEVDGRRLKGEFLRTAQVVNAMVAQLGSFASEVTRVAREVGTEGKLGGQARVQGVAGTWKDLTEGVNLMAGNLMEQVRNIAEVTTAVASGELGRKITVDARGEILELKDTINTMVDQLRAFAAEVTRVAREVGTDGKLGGQARVEGVAGTWKDLTESVNFMASNLTSQVRNIAEVTTAVAKGDLGRKITVDVKGEILELKDTINTMVDQLNGFASEVTRVAREVGTEGKLGGQAQVKGVAGTWKDLTDNVNSMASNLTNQVRGIAKVVTAVANGDLRRKLALQARGEIAELADTINGMTDTLATFADQVTTVAREVGVEGKLGGQAKVPGTAGTWRDLVDNVNQLAGNLTTQVRAIGDVATAVTKGDLTRSIMVEASGEVAALKDNINEMIRALRETTQKTTEQDWLKTNLARFTRMLQGQRDLVTVAQQVLSELVPLVGAQCGALYIAERDSDHGRTETTLKLVASYAYRTRKELSTRFKLGEGLVGQCAFDKQKIALSNVPADYLQISSGLGTASPLSVVVLPVLFEGQINAVIELASFGAFSDIHEVFLDQLTKSIGIVVNTIAASMRTESLLAQSQSLTQELRQTNEQLADKAKLLELKNSEVELAKRDVEEKAEQLALTSRYKSEFLANMSHELRTPLNSLLILSKLLSENPEGNLTAKQVEFAATIHSAGADLLALITDILDLSKIESGTMAVDASEISFQDLRDYVDQSFRHVADQKGLAFRIDLDDELPPTIYTDPKRLQQVLNNLLSNAFKFTEHGTVQLHIHIARTGWRLDTLDRVEHVIGFAVSDTGIGVAPDKQRVIFEAFQQADGTTSRRYGGTGLGLSISRDLTRLLGGEVIVASELGRGSTFTLFLPRRYAGVTDERGREPAPSLPVVPERSGEPGNPAGELLAGTIVLVVDDDVRNIFAITSGLERHGATVLYAETGQGALELLDAQPGVDVVLMDIMMPEMDGYEVTRRIRADERFAALPIIALTARAMPPDRDKCLRAGASDYIAKPVDIAALVAMLGVWVQP